MKFYFLPLLLATVVTKDCSKEKPSGLPKCVQLRIEAIKKEPRWNPPAQVDEYRYKGKTVYLFSADCCDQFTVVMDSECQYMCAPAGGLTGKGDRKCDDFFTEAQLVKTAWKDQR